MKRAELRTRIRATIQRLRDQGLTGQALLDAVADAVADDWVQDAGDQLDAGTEVQTVSSRHMIRLFRGRSSRYPIGWAVLHPSPDAAAAAGPCPYNRVDLAHVTGQPDHFGTFYCLLSPDGADLAVQEEVP